MNSYEGGSFVSFILFIVELRGIIDEHAKNKNMKRLVDGQMVRIVNVLFCFVFCRFEWISDFVEILFFWLSNFEVKWTCKECDLFLCLYNKLANKNDDDYVHRIRK